MTLNENEPTDNTLFSELDDHQRETRREVNDLSDTISGQVVGVQTFTSITSESLSVGAQMHELFRIDVNGTLSYITGANEGHIVYIKIQAGHSLTVNHSGSKGSVGDIFLNGTGNNFNMSEYDMLALVNINGDQETGNDGYWEELSRTTWA